MRRVAHRRYARLAWAVLCVCMSAAPAPLAWSQTLAVAVQGAAEGSCDVGLTAGTADERLVHAAWRMRCLGEQGRWDEFENVAVTVLDSPALSSLIEALPWMVEWSARAELHVGRAADAIRRIDVRLGDAERRLSSEGRARLLWYRAMGLRMLQRHGEAEATLSQLIDDHPASEHAVRALPLLPSRPRTTAQWLQLGHESLRGRNYPLAEQCYRAAACDGGRVCSARDAVGSGDATRYEAAYQLGFLLYRYRREHVDRALVWLGTVASEPGLRQADALYAFARAVQRMDRPEEGRRAWTRFLAYETDGERADEARWTPGWMWLDEDRYPEAVRALGAVRGELQTPAAQRHTHRWLAWARWRAGDHEGARELWRQMGEWDGANYRAQAAYWTAVSVASTDGVDSARPLFEAVVASWPTHWYGLLAARRLGRPLLDRESVPATEAVRVPEGWRTLHELALAGRVNEARWLALRREGVDQLAPIFRMAILSSGEDWRGWRTNWEGDGWPAVDVEWDAWRLLHPAFFPGPVQRAGDSHRLPPSLLWAIMQKESLYQPLAVSVSDAMGLMQVVPQTALAISRSRDLYYRDGMLFEPEVALDYGAWYLAELLKKYDGQYPLAIAAYNAGPVAMDDWIARNGGLPMDEFVEEIPFDQARDYVKSVFALMIAYELAAGRADVVQVPDLGGYFPDYALSSPLPGVNF